MSDLYDIDALRFPRIDRDIVEHVYNEIQPKTKGSQVAIEQTLQTRRDRGEIILGVVPIKPDRDLIEPRRDDWSGIAWAVCVFVLAVVITLAVVR